MNCKNCQSDLKENYEFCYSCGGKVVEKRITVKSLVTEFTERYFSFDNKFFSTFKKLFTEPEDVINGYINGVRGKYVDPFTYLIIALTVSGFQVYLIKKGYLGFDMEKFFNFPTDEKSSFDIHIFMNNFLDFQNIIIILTIPFFAFLAKLTMWKNKKYNFAEHNVVLAYSYTHITIFSAVFSLLGFVSSSLFIVTTSIMSLLTIVYMIYVAQRVFNFTALDLIKKIFLYCLFFVLFFILITILGIIIGILYKVCTS